MSRWEAFGESTRLKYISLLWFYESLQRHNDFSFNFEEQLTRTDPFLSKRRELGRCWSYGDLFMTVHVLSKGSLPLNFLTQPGPNKSLSLWLPKHTTHRLLLFVYQANLRRIRTSHCLKCYDISRLPTQSHAGMEFIHYIPEGSGYAGVGKAAIWTSQI